MWIVHKHKHKHQIYYNLKTLTIESDVSDLIFSQASLLLPSAKMFLTSPTAFIPTLQIVLEQKSLEQGHISKTIKTSFQMKKKTYVLWVSGSLDTKRIDGHSLVMRIING